MPQIFKIGSFWVYFWSNENNPLEPIHIHVSEGMPSANATKFVDDIFDHKGSISQENKGDPRFRGDDKRGMRG